MIIVPSYLLFNGYLCAILELMKTINLINKVTFNRATGKSSADGSSAYPDQAFLDDKEEAKRVLWYHATKNPNWLEEVVRNNATVHLGSKKSAFDRMKLLSGYTSNNEQWFLYAVWLTDKAVIASHYVEDMLDDWTTNVYADNGMNDDEWFDTSIFTAPSPMLDKEFRKMTAGNDFVRYVNLHENPGHISLFGNPSELELACVFEFDTEGERIFECDNDNPDTQLSYSYQEFHEVDLDELLGS